MKSSIPSEFCVSHGMHQGWCDACLKERQIVGYQAPAGGKFELCRECALEAHVPEHMVAAK